MLLIIVFMYLFGFIPIKQVPILTSTIVVGLILGLKFILDKEYRRIVISIITRKKIWNLFIILIIIQVYSICITAINNVYDFSIVKTFINQYITLIIGILVYCFFIIKGKSQNIIDYIIYAFIVQSIIQLVSFISPSINEMLNIFRSESAIRTGQWKYSGVRGLAISGTNFYGLACAYGLMYIFYFDRWKYLFKNNSMIKFISLLILFFGGLSAGRSSFIGLAISIIYFMINNKNIKKVSSYKKNKGLNKINIIMSILLAIFLVSGAWLITSKGMSNEISSKLENFNKFAFEMFYNFKDGKGLTTSSSSRMFNEMYFEVAPETFIVGDGAYTNKDGSYYRGTDVGYMRNILFFGIVGMIMLIIYQLNILFWSKEYRIFNCIIMIFLFIMHLKGDILGFLIITQSMLMLSLLSKINLNIKINM